MKRLIFTAIFGFFLLAGTGMTVHAEETKEKKETAEAKACCSSATAENTAEAACGDKAKATAEKTGCDSEAAAVQTVQETSKAGGCGGCSNVQSAQIPSTIPGECRKLPSGINNRAENR